MLLEHLFKNKNLIQFWICLRNEYHELHEEALKNISYFLKT